MDAITVLNQLHRLGVVARATPDGGLEVTPASVIPPELKAQVKALKPEILEHLASSTKPSDGPELLPAQSPWSELSDNAQDVWDALQAQGTGTLHLIDETGGKRCHRFTATKPSDLRELARRGLETFPRVKTLTVIAVLPEVAIWQLEPRTVN